MLPLATTIFTVQIRKEEADRAGKLSAFSNILHGKSKEMCKELFFIHRYRIGTWYWPNTSLVGNRYWEEKMVSDHL